MSNMVRSSSSQRLMRKKAGRRKGILRFKGPRREEACVRLGRGKGEDSDSDSELLRSTISGS